MHTVHASESEFDAIPMFRDLPAESKRLLSSGSSIENYERSTILFQQGAMPEFLFVVLDGMLHLCSDTMGGKGVTVTCARAGDFVLPAAVITRKPYLLQARSISQVRLLRVKTQILHELLESDGSFSFAFLKQTSEQIRINIEEVKSLRLKTGTQRFAAFLLREAYRQNSREFIVLPYAKTILASELDMTPESLSRVIAKLQGTSLQVSGTIVHFLDYDALVTLCARDFRTSPKHGQQHSMPPPPTPSE